MVSSALASGNESGALIVSGDLMLDVVTSTSSLRFGVAGEGTGGGLVVVWNTERRSFNNELLLRDTGDLSSFPPSAVAIRSNLPIWEVVRLTFACGSVVGRSLLVGSLSSQAPSATAIRSKPVLFISSAARA